MSERIERWVNVHSDGSLGTFWDSPPPTLPHARVAHFVEIRDGEDIAVNGDTVREWSPMAPWSVVDEARRERDAAIEHALTAERRLDAKINELRGLHVEVKELRERAESMEASRDAIKRWGDEWRDRALSAESQLNDARKRYRDDTAAKLLAAEYADSNAALPAGMTTDQYWINRAKWALIVAQHLADAAFGFPPEKEVSNG